MSIYVDVYLRVSSKNQGSCFSNSCSLQSQLENCKKYAEQNNMIIDNVYQDIGSGFNFKNRPDFKRMVRNLYFKTILVSDISRFHRNVYEGLQQLEKFCKKQITLISVNDNLKYGPNSNLNEKARFRRTLGYAEDEWLKISNRINNSIKYRKNRGDYIGNPPFGFKTERNKNNVLKLVEDKNEQNILAQIKKFISQKFSYEEVAEILNENNIKKRQKIWNKNMVKYVVKKNNLQTKVKKTVNKKIVNKKIVNKKNNYYLRSKKNKKYLEL